MRARALTSAADFARELGDFAAADRYSEESLALFRELGDQPGIARALHELGETAIATEDYDRAVGLFEQGRISSGRAAELCGLPRVDFLFAASRAGVPVADLDAAELDREFSDD